SNPLPSEQFMDMLGALESLSRLMHAPHLQGFHPFRTIPIVLLRNGCVSLEPVWVAGSEPFLPDQFSALVRCRYYHRIASLHLRSQQETLNHGIPGQEKLFKSMGGLRVAIGCVDWLLYPHTSYTAEMIRHFRSLREICLWKTACFQLRYMAIGVGGVYWIDLDRLRYWSEARAPIYSIELQSIKWNFLAVL
ncbi:hypothetical protein BOTBODRAFT_27638, partial [Botryobasidium botryosum FD-172 SS1]